MRRGIRKSALEARLARATPDDDQIERRDGELLRVLGRDFERAADLARSWLECGPGCADCCHGPFPITRLDAWRLTRGMEQLGRREPGRAAALRSRAGLAVATLERGFPGKAAIGRLDADASSLDGYLERHEALACPALDPDTRSCELYESRPVPCRTYGPPLRFGGDPSPPCPVCFRGAYAMTVERCRIAPDEGDLEGSLLRDAGVGPGQEWETLIPFVLEGRAAIRTLQRPGRRNDERGNA